MKITKFIYIFFLFHFLAYGNDGRVLFLQTKSMVSEIVDLNFKGKIEFKAFKSKLQKKIDIYVITNGFEKSKNLIVLKLDCQVNKKNINIFEYFPEGYTSLRDENKINFRQLDGFKFRETKVKLEGKENKFSDLMEHYSSEINPENLRVKIGDKEVGEIKINLYFAHRH